MATGDLNEFRAAGRALFVHGLVKGSEGNLSTFDGARLRITRTGARLFELDEGDVLVGTPDRPPAGASSDLDHHLAVYRELRARAVAHAHPPGGVPEGWREGEPHGAYGFGLTLIEAVAAIVASRDHGWTAFERTTKGPRRLVGYAGLARPVGWDDGTLRILDQRSLPFRETYVECRTSGEVAAAIRRLAVRGAPVLGIAAAYALVLAAKASRGPDRSKVLDALEHAGRDLVATRPTAVNIRWAVERVLARAKSAPLTQVVREAVLDEARRIEQEDAEACAAMGRLGSELAPDGANVLTHCNTGMLCTAGLGTALGVVYDAYLAGKRIHVWVGETRPVLQGARLTTWELARIGVPFTLIADAAAASLMSAGKVDLVLVGADRIAANGDVANKIGTYGLAVLARHHGVPFYVVAPTSTVDAAMASGDHIEIEERDHSEVTAPLGVRFAPESAPAANPAFDVTPAELVTAIVTERGVVRPPFERSLRDLLSHRGAA